MASGKRIPYLDGWRGLAIITVLFSHFVAAFEGSGTLGVDLFFVLSGYLLGEQLFIDRVPLVPFFKRRFSRVYPAFLFYILTMLVYAKYGQTFPFNVTWSEIFYTLTFLRTYFPSGNSIWSDWWPIGHIWSLNVEEHSYLWFGLVILICRPIKKPVAEFIFLLSSVLLSIFFVLLYTNYSDIDTHSPWHIRTECAAFSIFASAAYRLARHRFKYLQTLSPKYLAPAAMILGLYFYTEKISLGPISLLTPLFLVIAINHLGDTYSWILKTLSLPFMRWFGACSFSVYLWQQLFYTATLTREPWVFSLWNSLFSIATSNHLPWASQLPGYAMIIPTVAIGVAAYYLLEKPMRTYLNKRWKTSY